MTTRIQAHQFDDHDHAAELAMLERLLDSMLDTIHVRHENLGAGYQTAIEVLGYRLHLNKPKTEIIAALQKVVELGVALFERGQVMPGETLEVSLFGQQLRLEGGVTSYHSAARWIDAIGAALCLRDTLGIGRLLKTHVSKFFGGYDVHLDHLAQAVIDHYGHTASPADQIDRAGRAVEQSYVAPERALKIGRPSILLANSVLVENGAQFNEHLAQALYGQRAIYEHPELDHRPEGLVNLFVLGMAALAYDQGTPCTIESAYLPRWVVERDFE